MKHTHDVIVIGGGAAGLTASGISANLGAKTLMIERSKLGGDCTWTGCVPSKTLIKAAKVAHQTRNAGHYGLVHTTPNVDFTGLMRHVHTLREEVYLEADDPSIYERMGVELMHGNARFIDDHTVEVENEGGRIDHATGRFIIIAAGGRPATPAIKGLDTVPHLTNESLFELDVLPKRLGVIGAGPIGTEMAQAFNRLGAAVTVFARSDRILPRDDEELAGMLRTALDHEGIAYKLGAAVESVRQTDGSLLVWAGSDGQTVSTELDGVLVATGRVPNVESLNLEAAGLTYDAKGITVDDRCRTNKSHIFGVGDVTGRYQFTHMSEHMAKVAVTNALLKWPMKIDAKHVPWTTFTDPELAHVGETEADLIERGESFEVYRFPYTKLDRALTDGESTGLIKVFAKGWNGRILGADVLGASAGEMIGEYALAMRHGIRLRQISDTIHPYPTYGLGVRRAADQWYVRKQSPVLVRLLQTVFRYRGPVNRYEPGTVV